MMNNQRFFKSKANRNNKYLAWVRSMPCLVCGTDQQIHAHHLIGHGTSGMGTKSSDLLTMPLCTEHHHELHTHGHKTFDKKYRRMNNPAQIYFVNLTLGRARVQKVLTAEQVAEARELIK